MLSLSILRLQHSLYHTSSPAATSSVFAQQLQNKLPRTAFLCENNCCTDTELRKADFIGQGFIGLWECSEKAKPTDATLGQRMYVGSLNAETHF